MSAEASASVPWLSEIPRPSTWAHNTPWPPVQREYPEDHPGRNPDRPLPLQPYNWDWAIADFGGFAHELKRQQENFGGDWWLLCLVAACLEGLKEKYGSEYESSLLANLRHYLQALRQDGVVLALQNCRISNYVIKGLDLDRVNLERARLQQIRLVDVSLNHAMLSHSIWTQCQLERVGLSCSSCRQSRFTSLVVQDATFDGVVLTDAFLEHARLERSSFQGAIMAGANLRQAVLKGADLRHADFERATLSDADLSSINGHGASFRSATLANSVLVDANLSAAVFNRADISGILIAGARIVNTSGLFGNERATQRNDVVEDWETLAAVFWWQSSGWWWLRDLISWQLLRLISGLRLFGVSYLAVILITAYALLARWYNTQMVEEARGVAEKAGAGVGPHFWVELVARMPDLPVPSHLGLQLVATGALALAATIYHVWCPDVVKQADEVHWSRGMSQPLWEYRAAKWARPVPRYAAAILFGIGAGYSLWYLITKSTEAISYMINGR